MELIYIKNISNRNFKKIYYYFKNVQKRDDKSFIISVFIIERK